MNDIIIDYYIKTDNLWRRIVLSPHEYFDKDESSYSINSIAKCFLEPRDYISADRNDIVFLNFYISNDKGNRHLTRFTYWGNGLNQIMDHNEYQNEKLTYRTIVQSIGVANGETLLLRLEEINGQLIPISHSITDSEEQYTQINDLSIFDSSRI